MYISRNTSLFLRIFPKKANGARRTAFTQGGAARSLPPACRKKRSKKRAGNDRARKTKKRRKALIHWGFDAADGALGGIRTHGLPLRSFFQAEAHNRFLCHAMAKTAIKSGGFRRLHYARHFPLRHRLRRMELLKKLHQLANHTFERFRSVFGVVTGVTSDKAAPSAQFMDGAALLFGR